MVKVYRFHAQPVTGKKQPLARLIPNGECEHAVQLGGTLLTVFLISMQNRLGIRFRLKTVSLGLQLMTDVLMVINLPIENDGAGAVFVIDWLRAGHQIDDAETAHTQANVSADMKSFIIRAAMRNDIAHALDVGRIYLPFFIPVNYAANSAHYCLASVAWSTIHSVFCRYSS